MTMDEAQAEGRRRFGPSFGQVRVEGCFLKGWISDLYEVGYRPDMSEPVSALPEVEEGRTMKVVTGFLMGGRD
jgi:hypothetical protein